jgi:hypothetical protein
MSSFKEGSFRSPELEGAPSNEVSPSVGRAVEGALGDVTSFELVARLLTLHPEYGGGKGEALSLDGDHRGAPQRSASRWLAEARAVYEEEAVPELHGRQLILGLALVDSGLRAALTRDGFLDRVESEIREPIVDLLKPRWHQVWRPPDSVPTLPDRPAALDLLDRDDFAHALAARIQGERDASIEQTGRAESFLVHLHGPWGCGKSSLLNFLAADLHDSERRWVVVWFNAWLHERAGPPWWNLMTAVHREAIRDPFRRLRERRGSEDSQAGKVRVGELARSVRLWFVDLLWRFRLGWMAYLLLPVLAVLFVLALQEGLFAVDLGKGSWVDKAAEIAKPVGALIGLLVSLFGAARALMRSLSVDSAQGAQTFIRNTRDPLRKFKQRFRKLVSSIDRPVAIFVDDLDRCQAQYVVDVLQGIQTLLIEAPVAYVVAADRRWLNDSYAKVYGDFVSAANEPGKPLGHLFLEKTFQLSAAVPNLSPARRESYWHRLILLEPGEDEAERERIEKAAEEEVGAARSEEEVLNVVEKASRDQTPRQEHAIRSAAVRRLAAPPLERRTEHRLKAFAPLLEPNPRAMKRLVNAYGIERDRQLLEGGRIGTQIKPEQLALWTIVNLRWPALGDYLSDDPDAVVAIANGSKNVDDPSLAWIARCPDVKRVLNGGNVGAPLTAATVRALVGRES